jgi:hypothetical protein
MSSSLTGSDFLVYLTQQATQGQVDSNPVFTKYRRTGGKPEKQPGYTNSNEVVTGRQAQRQILDDLNYEYTLEAELTQEKRDFIANALFGTYTTAVGISANNTIAFNSTSNQITDTGATGSLFDNVNVGQWIFVTGSTNDENNIAYYVTGKPDADTLQCQNVPQTVAEGDPITIGGQMVRSADDRNFLTVQRRVTNTSQPDNFDFTTQLDAFIGQWTLTVPPTGIVTNSFAIQATQQLPGLDSIPGQTDLAEDTSNPISAVTDVLGIYLNYEQVDADLTEMSVDFNSNLTAVDQAGFLGAKCISPKTVTCSGTLNAIETLDNPLRMQLLYENSTAFSLSVLVQWTDGRKMVVTMHNCLYTAGSQPDGADDDALFQGTYTAQKDNTFNTTVQVDVNW